MSVIISEHEITAFYNSIQSFEDNSAPEDKTLLKVANKVMDYAHANELRAIKVVLDNGETETCGRGYNMMVDSGVLILSDPNSASTSIVHGVGAWKKASRYEDTLYRYFHHPYEVVGIWEDNVGDSGRHASPDEIHNFAIALINYRQGKN